VAKGDNGRPDKPDHRLSALDKAIQTAIGQRRKVGRDDDPARELYPDLWDWLTRTGDGGDHVMQPASMSVQLGPEGVLVTLTHRDLGVSCSVACPMLADVLSTLQAALACPDPPIRNWGKTEPKLRKRRS